MTTDKTENIRHSQIDVPTTERLKLERLYGEVWDTDQMSDQFEVQGFIAPYVAVRRKSDDCLGSLVFQDYPRFYFNFTPK